MAGSLAMEIHQWPLIEGSSQVFKLNIYSHLLVFTLVPWFPFSLSVGDLASVNGIHQWPVIRRWTTMFDLDTSIHIVGNVLISVCVEDLPDWWHILYAASLIVHVFMRFQLSWLDSSICQMFPTIMEILIHYISLSFMEIMILRIYSSWIFELFILYVAMTTHVIFCIMPIHGHCILMYLGLVYLLEVMCIVSSLYYTIGWMVLPPGSSSLHSGMDL